MFRRSKLSFLSTKDDRIKVINERINLTERHLMEMCSAFSLLTRKMAKWVEGAQWDLWGTNRDSSIFSLFLQISRCTRWGGQAYKKLCGWRGDQWESKQRIKEFQQCGDHCRRLHGHQCAPHGAEGMRHRQPIVNSSSTPSPSIPTSGHQWTRTLRAAVQVHAG